MKAKTLLVLSLVLHATVSIFAAAEPAHSSYAPVIAGEPFAETMARMKVEKSAVMKKQMDLLGQPYDLRNDPAPGVTMSGGKPIQQEVRVKLKNGTTWAALMAATPEDILARDIFPDGFLALPHSNHPEGGMVFPKFHIDQLKRQEARDLTRFDLGNGTMTGPDGPVKTFPLRGIKDSPPYLHDGRLLTLKDTVEFFNLVLGTKLVASEKVDSGAFLTAL